MALDPAGEFAVQSLFNWQQRAPQQLKKALRSLAELRLLSGAQLDVLGEDILRLMVRPAREKGSLNIADVGFGVSQVMPIIIRDVSLGSFGTLLVNQPEVHLHPSAQAQLANYFADRTSSRRYLIETHSEYLINRLRLLVAKGELDPKAVLIHYFDRSSGSAVRHYEVELERTGALAGAPDSFFETYSADAFTLAMAVTAVDK